MKICVCFIGLQRTIEQTIDNIRSKVFDNENTFDIIFVTWANEDTTIFERCFPSAKIYKIQPIDDKDSYFLEWINNYKMHISWRNTYPNGNDALFRYFIQIYLWKKAVGIIDTLQETYDLVIRMRTDIKIHGTPIHIYYTLAAEHKNVVYFPNEQGQCIFPDKDYSLPDQLFMGNPDDMKILLSIIDHMDICNVTYTETILRWFGKPQLETNILHPETSLYIYSKNKLLTAVIMQNRIEVIR